ncbi:CNOT6L [Cordylochernes scorpioides]|uniref:CNOT6L n=1 Tax=Cordylochernes scorpioides TaxID=51811 RepID=A0ABY6KY81_9ARAC|nr:CNOT6L [Cordylochernes scorpioides]
MPVSKNDAQTQEQLAASLNVTRRAVLLSWHGMRKIQKEGKWLSHEVSEKNKETRFLKSC